MSMPAVDTNILVYAFLASSPFHGPARAEVTSLATGRAPWAIPWPCVHEFYAVVTNPRLFPGADLRSQAREQVGAWLESPTLHLLAETTTHWRTISRLLEPSGVRGPKVHDARIAAICIDHGVTELLTLDRDFAMFPELRVRNLAR